MTTTEHPLTGLRHAPYPAQWADTLLYGPDWRSRSGHTAGWWWATDGSTLCGIEDGAELDEDDVDQSDMARKAVGYLTEDLIAPLYAVDPRDMAVIGGIGRLRDWGLFDLDRVHDAAGWVAGEDGRRLVLAVTPDPLALRLVSPTGRVAVVMGMRLIDEWYPAIDLPVEDVTPTEGMVARA